MRTSSRLLRALKRLQERFSKIAEAVRREALAKKRTKAKLVKQLFHVRLVIRKEQNHARPHFHIHFKSQFSASYAIDTLERLAGSLPRRYEEEMLNWARANKALLLREWIALKTGCVAEAQVKSGEGKRMSGVRNARPKCCSRNKR